MFSFITTKVLAWACAGLLAALLVTGTFAGCEHRNANEARAERDSMKDERNSARDDRDAVVKINGQKQETIERQDAALSAWATLGVTPEDVRQMIEDATRRRAELERLIAEGQSEREKDNANPDCEKLRQVDFERVCPHRARVLRRYENRLPRRPGG